MCQSDYNVSFNETQFINHETGRIFAAVIGLLSAVAALLIIVTSLAIPTLRRATSRRLLVYLSIADLVASLSNAVGALHFFIPIGCYWQAAFTVAGNLSSVLWSTCFAVYLYICIVRDNVALARRLEIAFHLICWGCPVVVAAAGLQQEAYGSTAFKATVGWCWIRLQPVHPLHWDCWKAGLLWMLLSLKGWECASYAIIPTLYFKAKYSIRHELRVRICP